jgi:hypothetical protein
MSKQIKLKNMLNENTPGYKNRKFGDKLPTLEDIQTAHQAKQSLKEEYIESMDSIEIDKSLSKIQMHWLDWKRGPMTDSGDIKPAQKELLDYVSRFMKKNIK